MSTLAAVLDVTWLQTLYHQEPLAMSTSKLEGSPCPRDLTFQQSPNWRHKCFTETRKEQVQRGTFSWNIP